MFIPYTGPSSKKKPTRGSAARAITAVKVASGGTRRRHQEYRYVKKGSKVPAGGMHCFHVSDWSDLPSNSELNVGGGGICDIEPDFSDNATNPSTLSWILVRPNQAAHRAQMYENGLIMGDQGTRNGASYSESNPQDLRYILSRQTRNRTGHAIQWPVNSGFSYPIPKKPYFPALLFQRGGTFLPVADQYRGTFAHNLHTRWNQTVLSDACLFHATIFATSSFMDLLQGRRDNPVTLYHKQNVCRLVQDGILKSQSHGLSDSVITAAIYLVYFAKLSGELGEGTTHDDGVLAMIKMRAANPPAADSIPGWCIAHWNLWNSLFSGKDTLEALPTSGPKHVIGSYTSLLAIATYRQLKRPPDLRVPCSILELLVSLNRICTQPSGRCEWPEYDFFKTSHGQNWPAGTDKDAEVALRCCYIAASIYWRAVIRACRKADYQDDVRDLQVALSKSDTSFWFRFGPEVLRWVLMTGAAATTSEASKSWFIGRCYMVSAIVRPEDMEEYLVGADHLLWVFHNRGL
ncbi:hypothetical protein BJX68DRAFT_270773 [Aspergillus pseudodeflectus]|uniref:Uncharacterized protein n=1 Tax=Aspergillus pseudodeflectus TaxID=176178 RepID=A0ABR4JQM1_9EURO